MPRPRRDVPWIATRDNGVYYANWYNAEKRCTDGVSLRTRDAGEATARFAAFLTQGRDVYTSAGSRGSVLTVAEALDSYLREHVNSKVVDKAKQEVCARRLKAVLGAVPLKDVDMSTCEGYATSRKRDGVKPSTIRRELGVLAAAANYARKRRRITLAEMPVVDRPPEEPVEIRWLTVAEIDTIRATMSRRIRELKFLAENDRADQVWKHRREIDTLRRMSDWFELTYHWGARREAVESLRWSQVDFRAGVVHLNPPGRAQTKKRRPTVPITPEVRPMLERLYAVKDSDFVLGKHQDLYRPFVRICAAAGIDAHPHCLRHSRITHLLMDGRNPYAVARLVGDTIQTLDRVYGHMCPNFLAGAIGEARA